MKFISWNVNGLRACMGKGLLDYFQAADADFFCLQETKMQPDQLTLDLPGYRQYWYSAEKKGYSGTAVFSKHEPLSVTYGLPQDIHNHEGRAITLEFDGFYLVNIYTPNAQDGLARIDYRMQWEDDFRAYVKELDQAKPVIMCGDSGTPAGASTISCFPNGCCPISKAPRSIRRSSAVTTARSRSSWNSDPDHAVFFRIS